MVSSRFPRALLLRMVRLVASTNRSSSIELDGSGRWGQLDEAIGIFPKSFLPHPLGPSSRLFFLSSPLPVNAPREENRQPRQGGLQVPQVVPSQASIPCCALHAWAVGNLTFFPSRVSHSFLLILFLSLQSAEHWALGLDLFE